MNCAKLKFFRDEDDKATILFHCVIYISLGVTISLRVVTKTKIDRLDGLDKVWFDEKYRLSQHVAGQ